MKSRPRVRWQLLQNSISYYKFDLTKYIESFKENLKKVITSSLLFHILGSVLSVAT